jgi:serine/threonine protein kinase
MFAVFLCLEVSSCFILFHPSHNSRPLPCLGGDLFNYVVKHGPLQEAQALYVIQQLTSALQYLHQKGISHLDISPENVLLDIDNGVYLTDFGMATDQAECHNPHPSRLSPGKAEYAAPEVKTETKFQPVPADVFSLGVVLAVVLSGRHPYASWFDYRFQLYVNGTVQTWDNYFKQCQVVVSQSLCHLLANMVTSIDNRITLDEVARTLALHPVEPLCHRPGDKST